MEINDTDGRDRARHVVGASPVSVWSLLVVKSESYDCDVQNPDPSNNETLMSLFSSIQRSQCLVDSRAEGGFTELTQETERNYCLDVRASSNLSRK